jgi:ATP-dependent Clp protease ATP-binding subunit ClpC
MSADNRLTKPVRAAIATAEEIATNHRTSSVGCDHLIVGLLNDDRTLASLALISCGIILANAERSLTFGTERRIESFPALNAEAKSALASSLSEALALRSNYIGPEHLLLAILTQATEGVRSLLAEANTNTRTVRAQVRYLVADPVDWDPDTLRAVAVIQHGFADPAARHRRSH